MLRGSFVSILTLGSLCVVIAAPLGAIAAERGSSDAPLAIDGFDPTVFFDRGAAIRGREENAVQYKGATYWFRTEANKAAFNKAPFQYVPQYGGHGAYGIFLNEVVEADPRLWSVENGRLYLFSTADRRDASMVEIAAEAANQRFDLANGPLLRARYLRCSEDTASLAMSIHHIVFDGWSFNLFMKELRTLI